MGRRTKINLLTFFFFCFISIPLAWSLFKPGFFQTHDGDFFVIRLFEFDKSLRAGQIPPRWAGGLNQDYGVPIFTFFYPGSLYLAEIFHLIGSSLVDSLKLILILSFPLSAFGMYLFGKRVWGFWGGIISGLFYLIAPYRFLDVYVRGQIGEILALTFAPYIFWAVSTLAQKFDKPAFLIGSFSLLFLIISHNIIAFIFLPIIIFYAGLQIFFSKTRKIALKNLFLLFLIGFLLSAFFILPALAERKYVNLGKAVVVNFREHFPTLRQLIYSPWGYGYSEPGLVDGMSFQLGVAHQVVLLLTLGTFAYFVLKKRLKEDLASQNLLFFVGVAILSIFLTLEISTPAWTIIPFLLQAQFPWRFNSLTIFSLSFLSGSLVRTKWRYALIILIPLLFYNNRNYLRPGYWERHNDSYYLENQRLARGTTSIADEILPVWVEEKPQAIPQEKIEFLTGGGEIVELGQKPNLFRAKIQVREEGALIKINITYYPGWLVYLDGGRISTTVSKPYGAIELEIPRGEHSLEVKFVETPIRFFSNLLFLLGVLLLGIVIK